jgi:hypothetical protein
MCWARRQIQVATAGSAERNANIRTAAAFRAAARHVLQIDQRLFQLQKRAHAERALEAAGVEFISENGGGPGVRLRKG